MARYSRRRGPAVDFELTGVIRQVPGLLIDRLFDDGEVLVLAQIAVDNSSLADIIFTATVSFDGDNAALPGIVDYIPAGTFATIPIIAFQPVTEGRHTFEVWARGGAGAGDTIFGGGSELVVIQLPLWDSGSDIITL